jgi:hypothetical protein
MSKKKTEKKIEKKGTGDSQTLKIKDFKIGWGWVLLGLSILVFLLFANTLARGHLIEGSDQLLAGYMFKSFAQDAIRTTGQFPLWNPYIFGGLPYIDALHGDALYVTALLRLVFPVGTVMALVFILQIIVAGIFTYGFLRTLKTRQLVALVGAVAYMFTGVIVSLVSAGHDGKVIVASFLPAGLFLIQKAFDPEGRKHLMWFALLGLVIGLALLSPHVQMSYYMLMMLACYIIFKFLVLGIREKRWGFGTKSLGLSFGSLVLGFAISAIQFLPSIAYLAFSPRGQGGRGWEWNTSWSLPRLEVFDLFNARFSGILQNYWGANAFKQHSEYFGIIIMALAIVGIILAWRRRETKFFMGFSVFGLLMALGGNTPFYYIPYYILPLLKSFRAPAMIFFTVAFSAVVLAALGLEEVLNPQPRPQASPQKEKSSKKGKRGNALTIVFAVLAGLMLIFAIWSSADSYGFGNFVSGLAQGELTRTNGPQQAANLLSHMQANIGNASNGFWLAFLFLAAGFVSIILWRRFKKLAWLWGLLLAGFVFADLWLVDRHFVGIVKDRNNNPVSADEMYGPDEVVNYLKGDPGIYRVFPLQYMGNDIYRRDDYLMLYKIQSVGGYHGNQLRRYQEFIGAPNTIMFRDPANLGYPAFLTMLDVKYLIGLRLPDSSQIGLYSPQDQATILALKEYFTPWTDSSRSNFRPIYLGQNYAIYRNEAPVSRAWVASDVEVVKDDAAILSRMKEPGFDPRKTVVLEEMPQGWANSQDSATAGTVEITRYEPNEIELRAEMARRGVLVLSENWYPWFRAWVDSKEQKVYRADYTLRALVLEPGTHKVEFRFKSPYVNAGVWITFVSLGLVALAVALSLIPKKRKDKKIG